jgi:hypothetical protein
MEIESVSTRSGGYTNIVSSGGRHSCPPESTTSRRASLLCLAMTDFCFCDERRKTMSRQCIWGHANNRTVAAPRSLHRAPAAGGKKCFFWTPKYVFIITYKSILELELYQTVW